MSNPPVYEPQGCRTPYLLYVGCQLPFLCLHKALGQMLYLEAKTSGKQVWAQAHGLLPRALCCCAWPQLQDQSAYGKGVVNALCVLNIEVRRAGQGWGSLERLRTGEQDSGRIFSHPPFPSPS